MAISNKIEAVFSYSEIDLCYDFFLVSTSEKYISQGAYLLDKPMDLLKAESVVFDNGRSLFIMFKKNAVSKFDLIDQLIDEKLTIKQIFSADIKDYILFRLFLYGLNNFDCDDNKFNNVAGKLYITRPKWFSKNKKTFKALNINVDVKMNMSAEAVTFTLASCFSDKKIVNGYPKYNFSGKNGGLKRTFELDGSYIRRSLFGKKAEIPFLDISKDKIQDNKVYFIYKVLDLMRNKYGNCLSFSFAEIQKIASIGEYRDKDFVATCEAKLAGTTLNVVNWSNSPEYEEEFENLANVLKNKHLFNIKISRSIDKNCLNFVYLHNKEYYEQNHYNDPYLKFEKDCVVQHLTIEDCSDKLINDNEAILNSILKELVIKTDLVASKKITLDDWSSLNISGRMIFGRQKENIQHFLIVNEDGTFEYVRKKDNLSSFKDETLKKCSDFLTLNKGKEKSVVADDFGNIVSLARTNGFILPSQSIFALESVSRSKESRDRYLDGTVDINVFNSDGHLFYNSGIKGNGMNTAIPKASLLYSVDVVSGSDILIKILETMSVPFVKYKSFTVMPYPFKYLNEAILMEEKES